MDWTKAHNRTMAQIEWEDELRQVGRHEPIQVAPTEYELLEIMKKQQKDLEKENG